MIVLMNRNFLGSILKSKQKRFFKITFICGGIIFPILTFGMNYYFIKVLKKGVGYILFSFIFVDTLIYIYYLICDLMINKFDDEEESFMSSLMNLEIN